MKHLRSFLVAIALIGAVSFANGQSKVAHVNVQQLLSEMPQWKAALAELQKLEDTYKADLQSSYTELQNKAQQYQNEAKSKTQSENEARGKEIDGLRQNVMKAEQVAQQELQKKQMELYEPLLKKANDAIQKVARAQGFQYVFDASPGSGIILADGKDLISDVKKELGF